MDIEQQKMMDEVTKKIKELNEMDMLEQFLKDNVNEFIFMEKHYRVRKPNPIEKEEANKERMKRYFEMLKDPSYMFRKKLISLYLTKGIDIEGMERDIKNVYLNEQGLLKKLKSTELPADIKLLETEIEACRQKQQEYFIEKEELLKYCIEQQLDDFLKFYLIYLVLEIKKEDKWEKVYASYDEFMQSPDEMLQAKAAQVFAVMIYHDSL